MLNKTKAAVGSALATVSMLPALAMASGPTTDFSALTDAVDFTDATTAVLAVAAVLALLYVAIKGIKIVIRMVKGG